jgi:hypothetical protein
MAKSNPPIFDDEELPERERIAFVHDDSPLDRPIRVEDPPPRPIPQAIDRDAKAWIPGRKVRSKAWLSYVGRAGFVIGSLALLASVFYVVVQIFGSYL